MCILQQPQLCREDYEWIISIMASVFCSDDLKWPWVIVVGWGMSHEEPAEVIWKFFSVHVFLSSAAWNSMMRFLTLFFTKLTDVSRPQSDFTILFRVQNNHWLFRVEQRSQRSIEQLCSLPTTVSEQSVTIMKRKFMSHNCRLPNQFWRTVWFLRCYSFIFNR